MSTEQIQTDLDSHHIEGIAIHGGVQFAVPLISHIDGNLWTGGCIDGVRLPDDFDFVVSMYPWERYILGPKTSRVEIEMYDASDMPPADTLLEAAEAVADLLAQGKTLVHCQAGLNRSGLIAGMALVLTGRTPAEAVALLREKRCDAVLCNPVFERYLLEGWKR